MGQSGYICCKPSLFTHVKSYRRTHTHTHTDDRSGNRSTLRRRFVIIFFIRRLAAAPVLVGDDFKRMYDVLCAACKSTAQSGKWNVLKERVKEPVKT